MNNTKNKEKTKRIPTNVSKKVIKEKWYPHAPTAELRNEIIEIQKRHKNKTTKKYLRRFEIMELFEAYGKPRCFSQEDFIEYMGF